MPARRLAVLAALLVVGAVTFVNAWCGEDAFITLRTLDNAVRGYGLTWNPYERVQAFTHPLWAMVLLPLFAVPREGYFTTVGLSLLLSLAVIGVAARALRERPAWSVLLLAALLVSSKAYVDYSTSGLENPLTHLLVVALYGAVLLGPSAPWSERRVTRLALLAALATLNRADVALAVAPALLWVVGRAAPTLRARTVRALAVGALPLVAWTAFSVVYYGFPFPNTAYAKLNGGQMGPWLHPNAGAYFVNSLAWDHGTLPLVALGVGVGLVAALRSRQDRVVLAPLAGLAAYLVYAVRIGGDYMSGRLFALPLLLAALVLVHVARRPWPAATLAAGAVLASLTGPRPPVTSAGAYAPLPEDATGVRDERGAYATSFGLLAVLREHRYDAGWAPQASGYALRSAPPRAIVWGAIGFSGFVNGPDVPTIDDLGLSDPLLARLPATNADIGWGRGHLVRAVPEGYEQSIELGENRIVDPALHRYYDALLLVTTGPIWRAERFRAIWALNTGQYRGLLDEYAAHVRASGK